jgi:prepilin-type N-terminal cleavage/methylation domain-containing protein
MISVSSSARRGFTLIELLVVIAIIGILSSVVLASLNTARNKGNDAAIKSNLAEARSQAEIFYDANGNKYQGTPGTADDVCSAIASATGGIKGINPSVAAAAAGSGSTVNVGGAADATHAACNASNAAWAAQAPLKTTGFYCVDSTGVATTTTAATLTSSAVVKC